MGDGQEKIKVLGDLKTFLRDSSSNPDLFNILADEPVLVTQNLVITASGDFKTIE